jgi:hypothetical protein
MHQPMHRPKRERGALTHTEIQDPASAHSQPTSSAAQLLKALAAALAAAFARALAVTLASAMATESPHVKAAAEAPALLEWQRSK